MEDRALKTSVKYELFYEGSEEPAGKTDRVSLEPGLGLELTRGAELELEEEVDAELVAIAFREAVHERRRVRDLAHCSAANLRIFAAGNPDEELYDRDFLRFLLHGAPDKIRVVAPPPPKALASPHTPGGSYLGTNRSRSIGSINRGSSDFTAGGPPSGSGSGLSSRRESSNPKRGDSDSVVVFVKTGDANFPVEVERGATVDTVKARIKEQEQIPLDQQRLIYGGVELESNRTLLEYNIHQGSELQLVLTLDSS